VLPLLLDLHQCLINLPPTRSIKGIAQRLYASEIFPLVSVKFMLMSWQASSQVIGDVRDPDDEEACPGTDGGEVDEEEYKRYVHALAPPPTLH